MNWRRDRQEDSSIASFNGNLTSKDRTEETEVYGQGPLEADCETELEDIQPDDPAPGYSEGRFKPDRKKQQRSATSNSMESSSETKPKRFKRLRTIMPMLVLVLETLLYPFHIVFLAKTLEPAGKMKDVSDMDFAFLLLGVALGLTVLFSILLTIIFKGTLTGRAAVLFLQRRHVKPAEIPGFIGLMIPVLLVWLYFTVLAVIVAVRGLLLTLVIYYIIRKKYGKGLRDLFRWWLKAMGRLAVRLRRGNYLGYIMPFLGGAMLANWLEGPGQKATPQSAYVVICFQLAFLIVLGRPLGKAYRKHKQKEEASTV